MSGPNQNNAFLVSELSTQRVLMTEVKPLLRAETLSIVGKSHKGTAFVPSQYWNLNVDDTIINTFRGELGSTIQNIENQGYLGGLTWLESGGEQLTFCRILGDGDDAGFTVGENIISGSSTPGIKGPNPFARSGGIKGKTYFCGKILSASQTNSDTISGYNDYFEQLGYSSTVDTLPIVTHVIMMPSGTIPAFKTDDTNFNIVETSNFDEVNKALRDKTASDTFGNSTSDNFGSFASKLSSLFSDLNDGSRKDILYINGLSGSNQSYRNELELNSFDFRKILWQDTSKLNTDGLYQIDRGNYLYVKFPCKRGIFKETIGNSNSYNNFIVSGSFEPSLSQPSFEDFKSSFKKAKTPWIVSQITNREKISDTDVSQIGDSEFDKLFRIYTYDDGEIGNRFRIRITPVSIGKKNLNNDKDVYSVFDLELYEHVEENNTFNLLTKFNRLNLDPFSEDFIGRVIGTEYRYYDEISGKIITKGEFRRTNPWIYVELNKNVLDRVVEPSVIPAGFEEYPHINLEKNFIFDSNHTGLPSDFDNSKLDNICQTPIEFVHCLYKIGKLESSRFGIRDNLKIDPDNSYWGISFNEIQFLEEDLRNKFIGGIIGGSGTKKFRQPIVNSSVNKNENKFKSYAKYFKSDQNNILNTWVTGSYQNSFFHLEKILITKTNNIIDWNYALYRRDGKDVNNISSLVIGDVNLKERYRYLNLEAELNESTSKYLSFDLFTYGGFDGLDIFDTDRFLMNNDACVREENNSLNESITIESYKKGLNLLKEYSNCTTDILSVPGISVKSVLNNLNKLNDNDPEYIQIKEIGFINGEDFITGSIIEEDKTINKTQNTNDKLINEIRLNSNPSDHFDYINSNNKNEFIVYNNLLSNIGVNLLSVSPSIPTIKSMAQNKFGPLDSLNILENQDQTTIKFISVLDLKYVNDNTTTGFNKNVGDLIKLGINAYSFNNGNIKLTSSNSTIDLRKSAVRQIFNSRILNSIKKDIKLNLFIDSSILFSQNSKISNLNVQAQREIEQVLENYRSAGIIKNYYTKIADNHNIKKNIIDLENYILRGNIYIELFTNVGEDTNLLDIRIQDILSDLSLNSEANIGDQLTITSI